MWTGRAGCTFQYIAPNRHPDSNYLLTTEQKCVPHYLLRGVEEGVEGAQPDVRLLLLLHQETGRGLALSPLLLFLITEPSRLRILGTKCCQHVNLWKCQLHKG